MLTSVSGEHHSIMAAAFKLGMKAQLSHISLSLSFKESLSLLCRIENNILVFTSVGQITQKSN